MTNSISADNRRISRDLFLLREVQLGGDVAYLAVDCRPTSSCENEASNEPWAAWILDPLKTEVRCQVVTTDATMAIGVNGTREYGTIPTEAMPAQDELVELARNCTYVKISPGIDVTRLPVFVSSQNERVPMKMDIEVEVRLRSLTDSPDVRAADALRVAMAKSLGMPQSLLRDVSLLDGAKAGRDAISAGQQFPLELDVEDRRVPAVLWLLARKAPNNWKAWLFAADTIGTNLAGLELHRTSEIGLPDRRETFSAVIARVL